MTEASLVSVEVLESYKAVEEEFDYQCISDPSNREWAESAAGFITFGLGQAVVKVLEAGYLLIEAQERLKHGEYLPWVQQACGLKPCHAQKLVKAAQWVNAEHVQHLDSITDTATLFLLSADATPEEVRQWALERCAVGDPPSRKEVQERKRQAQGQSARSIVQEAMSVLKLSSEARELANAAEHISTRQLMDDLQIDELPKGKQHQTDVATYCRNGTGWWKFPIVQKPSPSPEVPMQPEVLASEAVLLSVAAERLGKSVNYLRVRLSPKRIRELGFLRGNGWEARPHPQTGFCNLYSTGA